MELEPSVGLVECEGQAYKNCEISKFLGLERKEGTESWGKEDSNVNKMCSLTKLTLRKAAEG